MFQKVIQWHNKQFAYFLNKLRSYKENGTSLLDNVMLTYGSGMGDGHKHATTGVPIIVAGKGGGLNPGRLLSSASKKGSIPIPLSEIHLTTAHKMGISLEELKPFIQGKIKLISNL